MMDESIVCSQGLVPLTPRVVIHHQTKKRCTLKKEILIFGYVKKWPIWSQKLANLLQKLKILQKNHDNVCIYAQKVVSLRKISNIKTKKQ